MPTLIQIRERSATDNGQYLATVSFGEGISHDVVVRDPAGPGDEAELGWYFQEHLRFPFLDGDRRRGAVERIVAYGRDLFGQVFGGPAEYDYRRLRDAGLDGCRLVIAGSGGFHRLHWEALRDPHLAEPLAVRLPVTRQLAVQSARFDHRDDLPTLNLLVVTARPGGRTDVGYRTISRPLLAALRRARLPVTVEMVRPGTWEALRSHLQEATDRCGSGWYHVIHFDLHGAFGKPSSAPAGQHLFQASAEGGFLFFETARDGEARPVPTADVADLLTRHRIPVAVLNACQSAMRSAAESSLAQGLVAAGVPVAIGMAYSVTVSAAERAMPMFYDRLVTGADPVSATLSARQALHEHKTRRGYFNHELDLEDWLLPVAFAQRPVTLRLREMDAGEQNRFYGTAARVGEEPSPEYGFVGRDLDIHAVERHLLTDPYRNQLLVQGMAGAGKSTLLAHLGWWWARTGLVEQVFSFSYEDRAWTAAQIIRRITTSLLDREELLRLESMPQPAQLQRVVALLRARRFLLVIDNAESITASPAAIPHALSDDERDHLAEFIAGLRGGRTLVLIGSREDESWIAARSFGTNRYALPGLDEQAASGLAERILERHGGTRHIGDPALRELMALLGGYPLPLSVVLPSLATASPTEVLAELKAGGDAVDGLGLVRRAIEYSHGKLDPKTQNSLLLLAPFTAVVNTDRTQLELYLDFVADEAHRAEVAALGHTDIHAAIAELVRVGLAAPHPRIAGLVQIVPALPYFLRSRIADRPVLRDALEHAHYRLQDVLAGGYGTLIGSNDPADQAMGLAVVEAEYPNLTAALDRALNTGKPAQQILFAIYRMLYSHGQRATRQQLLERTLAAYRDSANPDLRQEAASLELMAAAMATEEKRLDDAVQHHNTAAQLRRELNLPVGTAFVEHQLGFTAQQRRDFEQAEHHYGKALDAARAAGDDMSIALVLRQLGELARDRRQLDAAERYYRQAMNVVTALGDHALTAAALRDLGLLARERHDYGQAENLLQQARSHAERSGDQRIVAVTRFQLGRLAAARGHLDEAAEHYRTALAICLDTQDQEATAATYHELGLITQQQGRLDQAEEYYRKALASAPDAGARPFMAPTHHQLGMVAHERKDYDRADEHYRAALESELAAKDWYRAASAHHQLGIVALDRGQPEAAEREFREALRLKEEIGAHREAVVTHRALATLFHHQGRPEQAVEELLRAALAFHTSTGRWPVEAFPLLRAECSALAPAAFDRLVHAVVPDELRDGLTAAMEADPPAGPDDL